MDDSPTMETFLRYKGDDDFTNQFIFLEDYDNYYDLKDKGDKAQPAAFSAIAYSSAEDPVTDSGMERYLHEIVSCKLPELFQTPAMVLANWPRWALEPYLDEGRKDRERARKTRDEMDKIAAQEKHDAQTQRNSPY